MPTPVYMALVHYPVLNKHGDTIATAITNLDVHDGCRMAATYGIEKFFLITPIEEQRSLVLRIASHWVTGPGATRNPKRKMAMSKATPAADLAEACRWIEEAHGQPPRIVGTSARRREALHISYDHMRQDLQGENTPVLLIFGTGWGVSEELQPPTDLMLPPISGGTDYNHLSVRAAMAITLDRLRGLLDS